MARIIIYDGRQHPDPDPSQTIEEIQAAMSTWYPDMANATHKTEKHGTDTHYVFRKGVGTKGNTPQANLAHLLLTTPPVHLEILQVYENIAEPDGTVDHRKFIKAHDDPANMEQVLAEANRYTNSVTNLTGKVLSLAR